MLVFHAMRSLLQIASSIVERELYTVKQTALTHSKVAAVTKKIF